MVRTQIEDRQEKIATKIGFGLLYSIFNLQDLKFCANAKLAFDFFRKIFYFRIERKATLEFSRFIVQTGGLRYDMRP